jgi:hypothetical protein
MDRLLLLLSTLPAKQSTYEVWQIYIDILVSREEAWGPHAAPAAAQGACRYHHKIISIIQRST